MRRKTAFNAEPLTWWVRAQVWSASEGKCHYCGCELDPNPASVPRQSTSFCVDHKTPRRDGGSNDLDNLVAACFGCNSAKGWMEYEEFVQKIRPGKAAEATQAAVVALTPEPARELEMERQTLNIEDIGKLLGISRNKAYQLARRDELPVPVIRLGRRMVVSKRALLAVLEETLNGGLL